MKLKRTLLPPAFFGLSVLCLTLAFVAVHAKPSLKHAPRDTTVPGASAFTAEEAQYWKGKIASDGGVDAYQAFSKAVAKDAPSSQHLQAHEFGGLLFEVEGIAALTACDIQFSMGCFHEFLGQAISSQGIGVIGTLAQECGTLDRFTQSECFHGIGHGIQAWLGYEPKDLLKGLKLCKAASAPYEFANGGCVAGLYMEFYFRTMISSDHATQRPLVDNNYLSPCDLVYEDDKPTCVSWLPLWWANLFHAQSQPGKIDTEALYIKLGKTCRLLGLPQDLTDACFEGIGLTTAAFETITPKQAAGDCVFASAALREETVCKGAVAWVFRHGPGSGIETACDGLTDTSLTYCMAYATGNLKVFGSIPVPEL